VEERGVGLSKNRATDTSFMRAPIPTLQGVWREEVQGGRGERYKRRGKRITRGHVALAKVDMNTFKKGGFGQGTLRDGDDSVLQTKTYNPNLIIYQHARQINHRKRKGENETNLKRLARSTIDNTWRGQLASREKGGAPSMRRLAKGRAYLKTVKTRESHEKNLGQRSQTKTHNRKGGANSNKGGGEGNFTTEKETISHLAEEIQVRGKKSEGS